MQRVYYNKLVRDTIKEIIEENGQQCSVRSITDDSEFVQELLKKVREEATALSHVRSREEFLNEYAGLMVVLDSLTAHYDFSEADIKTALSENIARKGLYQKRHFLHWSDDAGYVSNESVQGIKNT